MILDELTKEYIIERGFAHIFHYIARYKDDILSEGCIDKVITDLTYFRDALTKKNW